MHPPNFRHSKSPFFPDFCRAARAAVPAALLLASLAMSAPVWASKESEDAAQAQAAAEEQIKSANRQVLEQVRAGNRDSQQLMKLMAPALQAQTEALEKKAKIEVEAAVRAAMIEKRKAAEKTGGKKKDGKGAAKSAKGARPATPSNSLNGASRYGGAGSNEAPIMDPNSVPKDVTFEKGASRTQVVPTAQSMPPLTETVSPETATGTGGVDEIQFDAPAKPVAAPSAAKPKRGR